MYDIAKRRQFKTVGELRKLIENLPDNTEVSICGDNYCFYHEEQDKSCICLDCEDLEDYYEER
ncbi:MAG: hypothetical protein PHY23_01055 [Oscillospiraceae bacterium]|nr:hypothetical protein [Oscillospiraceae bacterium]